MPPGWTVTSCNVDWGKYQVGGHCTADCASDGTQQIDLCGSGASGAIAQTITTVSGTTYKLMFDYNAHGSCGGSTKEMQVVVDSAVIATVSKTRCGGWSDYSNCWSTMSYDITAASDATTVEFVAVDTSCGCMTLDNVSMKAA